MDPAFPDLVANWAASPSPGEEDGPANDNGEEPENDSADPLLGLLARMDIDSSRLW
jgi:hypothetical protein